MINTQNSTVLKIIIIGVFAIILIGSVITYGYTHESKPVNTVRAPIKNSEIVFGTSTIAVEVAMTPESWEKGLSGRTSLAANTGMLFVFNRPDIWGIWMKDMLFPIDIVWLDITRKVIKIEENVAPETYPAMTYEPATPARYVVELPAGTVKNIGITVGEGVMFKNK
jgi:uncharacterized membrane protein (UPF0127 family)